MSPAPRLFDGTDDKITLTLGATGFVFGPGTVAMLIRRNNTGVSQRPFMQGSAGATRLGIRINSSDDLQLQCQSQLQVGPIKVDATGWWLIAITKAAGTVLPRYHTFQFATLAWAHADAGATVADNTAPTAAAVLGANNTTEFWNGDIELFALWNAALTDQQIEVLAYSFRGWLLPGLKTLNPLWQSDTGQKVNDLTGGGAIESAITGTAVATSVVPLFNRGMAPIRVTKQPAAGGSTVTLDVSIAGAGAVTADAALTRTLAAAVAGATTVASDFVRQIALDALVNGTAVVVSGITATLLFELAAAGQATIIATLDLPAGGGVAAVIYDPNWPQIFIAVNS